MNSQSLKPRREQDAPIYLQLYRRYRDAIADGKLRPGDRVPSVRSLASELNLARGTVELAYQTLTSEGYFLTRGPAGTFVSPRLESLGESRHKSAIRRSATKAKPQPHSLVAEPLPFQLGLPALDAFPHKTWARLAGRGLRNLRSAAMAYPDPTGYEPLRRAIAIYLGISRGIECSHEEVFVTIGYRGALDLVCRTLLQAGDIGWHEDPGYIFARQFLESAGMCLEPVPVDEEGLNVDIGQRRAPHARFVVVTPTHQSPTGVALSLPRRLALLEWARDRRAWIVEDDYDSEFRYHGRPLPALKSLDRDGRVLYTGTFSKVLFPGLRLAYLVVPKSQVGRFIAKANQLPGPGSILPQATVADFMEQGHFARHLRKMRLLYATRRGYLVDALTQAFGSHLQVQPQAGGIHVLANLTSRRDDKALAYAAQSRGLAVQALSDWQTHKTPQKGLLMGFTNISEPEMARTLTRQLMKATEKN
ncbi:GntR family transcriptional regulator/MocR family aminotransferase [Rhodanobacter sp. ANJX3]|uniref:MocR-like pyridoxine biosynthesis transcription factor PdxR n=1 Tax=Rhodanobacter sp. ANJX3 TaxID=2723083 RepID=UPI00160AFBEF|nr:PLP-dependent aminotransferase family protein [Rhodanobacter sp. ANJX3]MBB5360024.1 GntR family transcriptional regulator/MocR family aminotransferase [Rhodanobacter sp. ANJX3]